MSVKETRLLDILLVKQRYIEQLEMQSAMDKARQQVREKKNGPGEYK